MKVVAVAGGIGAGKLLRGLVRVVPPGDVTVVGNVGDDMTLHGLHISPDLDSVLYWLAGIADRERGWGRRDESFRTLEELERLGGQAWFRLGDLDLATHLHRTQRLRDGDALSEVTAKLAERLGVRCRLIPATDDPLRTWLDTVDDDGVGAILPFQTYWVARRAKPVVKEVHFRGAEAARPAPGVLEAIGEADAVVICPSNPVVSVMPILAVPGIHEALGARRDRVTGISPIVGGAPLQGMADKLMPVMGLEVSARGAAEAYRGLLAAWVIDKRDAGLAASIEAGLGVRVAVTDTIMVDDEAAERLARTALEALG